MKKSKFSEIFGSPVPNVELFLFHIFLAAHRDTEMPVEPLAGEVLCLCPGPLVLAAPSTT